MHHFLALVDFQETILQWKEAAEAKSKREQLYDCPGWRAGGVVDTGLPCPEVS